MAGRMHHTAGASTTIGLGPRDHAGPCPFLERDLPHCSEHLTLQHLDQAFRLCIGGGHHLCPLYQQAAFREQDHTPLDNPHPNRRLFHRLTLHGRPLPLTA
ncbi:MAG: hypothetical protein AAF797_16075 [Planctomycetota bacterium]